MTKVPVRPDILKWAVQRSGIPSEKLKNRFPKYEQWESGNDNPTFKQLEDFANATYTPIGFMFLQEPPKEKLPVPYYRTIINDSNINVSVNLMDTIQTMQTRQAWMREYLIAKGAKSIEFVASVSINDDTNNIASKMRNALSLEEKWAGNFSTWTDALNFLRQVMEENGVIVAVNGVVGNNTRRILDPHEFRGFVLVDEYAPLVFINGADGKAAQMFTLAHELAHLFLGHSAIFDLANVMPSEEEIERKCDSVAAEFLVPTEEFKTLWKECEYETNRFQCIAKQFKVSEIVAARRALDLGVINKSSFFEFYNSYTEKEYSNKKSSGGGNFYLTQNTRIGKRFAKSVILATLEGRILYTDAYRLTGLYGKTFTNYAQRLGYEV